MTKPLALPSLEIHNFRGLRELKIERLGRANLIVGKNNVGKTSVLEALRLYASSGDEDVVFDLLKSRDEFPTEDRHREAKDVLLKRLSALFFGRRYSLDDSKQIHIGQLGGSAKDLKFALREKQAGSGKVGLAFFVGNRIKPFALNLEYREIRKIRQSLRQSTSPTVSIDSAYVSQQGITPAEAMKSWDNITLTPEKQTVIDGLRIISPTIQDLEFKPIGDSGQRVPFVKIESIDTPVPLKSLGDGTNRAFGIMLALVNSRGGILLVDEFENGIHYSVQPELWKLVFEMASRLNVQVIATTHSSDCIKAFEEASRGNTEEEGFVIRLARKGDRILVAEFDEEDLAVVVEGGIEVR